MFLSRNLFLVFVVVLFWNTYYRNSGIVLRGALFIFLKSIFGSRTS